MMLVIIWDKVTCLCLGKYLYFNSLYITSAPLMVSTVACYKVSMYALAHLHE